MKQARVEITQVEGSIAETLDRSLKEFPLKKKRRIFIKPNMSDPSYLPGVVTTPTLVYDLVRRLRDHAEEVIVGESNGYNYHCSQAFKGTGIEEAVKKAGGTAINLSEDKAVKVNIRNSPVRHLLLPKTLIDSDAVVDMPVMKTHEFKIYSGALKNLFGCVPDDRRIFMHHQLDEVLYQLYSILKPQLTVMDAITAMEGNGPTKGKPVKMNLILTSDDALAVDMTATKLMGIDWREIGHLNHAALKTGLGEEHIKVTGCSIADHTRRFELPRIDLPVQAQLQIYKSPLLTKVLFCQIGLVKIFQKATNTYRKAAQAEAN
jgi:uncharacterized protein (DUF362 family)